MRRVTFYQRLIASDRFFYVLIFSLSITLTATALIQLELTPQTLSHWSVIGWAPGGCGFSIRRLLVRVGIVQECLVAEGLYEKEALAMVNVWRKSWFTENGTRILYMVPQTLTDELIPLHINPAPKDSLRVLVGRMEVMSPSDEEAMIALVQQSMKDRTAFFANAKRDPNSRYQIPETIRNFGRMAEPALLRVSKIVSDPAVATEARALLAQFQSAQAWAVTVRTKK